MFKALGVSISVDELIFTSTTRWWPITVFEPFFLLRLIFLVRESTRHSVLLVSFCNENEAPLFYTWLKNSVEQQRLSCSKTYFGLCNLFYL